MVVVVWFLGFGFSDCFGVLISCGFLCFGFVVLMLCDLERIWWFECVMGLDCCDVLG